MSVTLRTVAHIMPWDSLGGTETATLRIARAVRDGFDHVAFCRADAPVVRDWFAGTGVRTAAYEPVLASYRRPRPFLRSTIGLARALRGGRVDLVHCADVQAAYFAAFAGRLAALPVVCHVRNRHDRIARHDRPFLAAVSRFVFVSRATWREFGYRVAPARGDVVYDGIATVAPDAGDRSGARAELGLSSTSPVVGMVARVAPQKDYATLVRALARVARVRPDVRLVVVGDIDRDHHALVVRDIERLGLTRHVVFTGFRDDVPRLISAMDVCVLSTHFEGLPLVLLEAMAQGRPVVATAVAGIPELIRHGDTGLLHDPGDDKQLASRLLDVLTDPALAARLGQSGHRFVTTSFTTARFASGIAGVYRRALGLEGKAAA
jgi:glycosyltransferase involved in cell wall biosynthesis